MPTLLIAGVLIAGIVVLALAIYSNSATRSQYRLGQASDIDMRRSSIHTAMIAVGVVAAIASVPLVWSGLVACYTAASPRYSGRRRNHYHFN